MLELGHRCAVDIVPEMGEHSRRYAPCGSLFREGLLISGFRLVSVDYFVETRMDVTAGDILKSLSSLQEKATVRNFHLQFGVVASPYVKAWISRLSVNCQKRYVVMEAGENGTDLVLREV